MPAGLLPQEGIGDQLEYILRANISGVAPWQMIFFKNNVIPDENTVLADLEEADFGGYMRLTMTRATWTSPTLSGHCATSTWGSDAVVWSVTGGPPQTLYGYAYIDFTSGVIRFVQRFDDADISPIVVGGQITLLPQYTLTSAAC